MTNRNNNILITGATGFLATELINQLQHTNYNVFALSSSKEKVIAKFGQKVETYNLDEWENGVLPLETMDVVIHCAFARAYKGGQEIAKSLLFTEKLFSRVIESKVSALINISSQEVYGKIPPIWREELEVAPNTIYGTAKYYSELLAISLSENKSTHVTSIRLAGLLSAYTESRMVNKFVDNAFSNQPLRIVDGKLTFSQLDVRDAVSGIIELLKVDFQNWRPIYNLGFTQSYSIQEIADVVKEVARSYNRDVEILKEPSDTNIEIKLDSSVFYTQTGWKPKYEMKSIVESIFEYKLNSDNGIK